MNEHTPAVHPSEGEPISSPAVSRTHHDRWVWRTLTVVAVLLLAGGFAAPQIVQAAETGARETAIAGLMQQQEELVELSAAADEANASALLQVEAAEVLHAELTALHHETGEVLVATSSDPFDGSLDRLRSVIDSSTAQLERHDAGAAAAVEPPADLGKMTKTQFAQLQDQLLSQLETIEIEEARLYDAEQVTAALDEAVSDALAAAQHPAQHVAFDLHELTTLASQAFGAQQ